MCVYMGAVSAIHHRQLRDRDAEQQLAIERKEKAQARRAARLPRADAAFDS